MFFFGGDKLDSQNVMSEYLNNLSLQALTIDDDQYEIQFFEIENLASKLKANMRDFIRYDKEIDDEGDLFEERFNIEKDKMQKMFDEIKNRQLSTLEYPNEDFKVLPDSPEKINEESKRREEFEKKNEEILNEENERILDEILLENKKKLMKSVTENSAKLSEGEINKITNISIPTVGNIQQSVDERLNENVKKDNEKFLKKSSVKISLRKKPYDRK